MMTRTSQPRASLHTLGCRLNQAEASMLGERLRRDGYRLVEFGQPTDLLVLNTCSVTEDAERTSRYVIRKTLKHSPHAFIAVTGCYAQTGRACTTVWTSGEDDASFRPAHARAFRPCGFAP